MMEPTSIAEYLLALEGSLTIHGRRADLLWEVYDHLREGADAHEATGMGPAEAERRAIAAFGSPDAVAASFRRPTGEPSRRREDPLAWAVAATTLVALIGSILILPSIAGLPAKQESSKRPRSPIAAAAGYSREEMTRDIAGAGAQSEATGDPDAAFVCALHAAYRRAHAKDQAAGLAPNPGLYRLVRELTDASVSCREPPAASATREAALTRLLAILQRPREG